MKEILFCVFLALLIVVPVLAENGDSENIDLVGSFKFWDKAWDIETYGNLAFILTGYTGVRLVDISDPETPVEIGNLDIPNPSNICFQDDLMFTTADTNKFIIYDISSPLNPVELGRCRVGNCPTKIIVSENLAYVSDSAGGFFIIDISDLSHPTQTGWCDIYFESTNSFDIHDGYAFLVGRYYSFLHGSHNLIVVNIQDPYNPFITGAFGDSDDWYSDIIIRDDVAFISHGCYGLRILDISNPLNIDEISCLPHVYDQRKMAIEGNLLFMANGWAGFSTFDISDLENPVYLSSLNTTTSNYNYGYDVGFSNDHIVLAIGLGGIITVNVDNPEEPVHIGSYGLHGEINEIKVKDNYAYLTGLFTGLLCFDVSDPSNPEFVDSLNVSHTYDIRIKDDRAYVSTTQQKLIVVDISDPEEMCVTGSIDCEDYFYRFSMKDDKLFLANGMILDISDPDNPYLINQDYALDGYDVAINGDYAFLTRYRSLLRIIDISNPLNIDIDAALSLGTAAYDIALYDNKSFISTQTDTIIIVDISHPTSPELLTKYISTGSTRDIEVENGFAYVTTFEDGIRILNVSDRNEICEVGYYDTPYQAQGVEVDDNYVYVADTYEFFVFDCQRALGAEESEQNTIPEEVSITKAYPNPFNPTLNVEIALPLSGELNVSVYNIQGQLVGKLANGVVAAGTRQLTFDGHGLSSGVYFIRAELPGYAIQTKKVVLMK